MPSSPIMFEESCKPDVGRLLRANTDIAAGTCIFKETGVAAVLDKANIDVRCSWCFTIPKSKLLRCSSCKLLYYCSTLCQREDYRIHKNECKALVRMPQLPPTNMRLAMRVLLAKSESLSLGSLVSHRSLASQSLIEELMPMAAVIQRFLNLSSSSPQEILEVLLKLKINAVTILDKEMIAIGAGLYTNFSSINHSCIPNCCVVFVGQQLFLRSLCEIAPGEELSISYMESFQSVEKRRAELHLNYYFLCECARCCADGKKKTTVNPPEDISRLLAEINGVKQMTISQSEQLHKLKYCWNQHSGSLDEYSRLTMINAIFDLMLHHQDGGSNFIEMMHWASLRTNSLQKLLLPLQQHPTLSIHSLIEVKIQAHNCISHLREIEPLIHKTAHRLAITHGKDHPIYASINEFIMQLQLGARKINVS